VKASEGAACLLKQHSQPWSFAVHGSDIWLSVAFEIADHHAFWRLTDRQGCRPKGSVPDARQFYRSAVTVIGYHQVEDAVTVEIANGDCIGFAAGDYVVG
jgi:hypothetical protein